MESIYENTWSSRLDCKLRQGKNILTKPYFYLWESEFPIGETSSISFSMEIANKIRLFQTIE